MTALMRARSNDSTRRDVADTQSAIVRRAQAGDTSAFETLYRTHCAAVHGVCRHMVGSEDEARALVQDVFVRAWEKLPSFKGNSALGTWLHRLAVNVVLVHLRTVKRERLRFLEDDEQVSRATARGAGPDERIDIETAVRELPNGSRTVFVLHEIYGYAHDDIATMMGIATGTVRAQLWRARRALAEKLEP